jgi:hypothetical protein
MEKIEGEYEVLPEHDGQRWLHKGSTPIGIFTDIDGEVYYKHHPSMVMTAQTARFIADYIEKEMKK